MSVLSTFYIFKYSDVVLYGFFKVGDKYVFIRTVGDKYGAWSIQYLVRYICKLWGITSK